MWNRKPCVGRFCYCVDVVMITKKKYMDTLVRLSYNNPADVRIIARYNGQLQGALFVARCLAIVFAIALITMAAAKVVVLS